MKELIASRYVKALLDGSSKEEIELYNEVFKGIEKSYNENFKRVMFSPDVKIEDKKAILKDSIKIAKSDRLSRFVDLLVEENRIDIIPDISKAITFQIAKDKNSYEGSIYSDSELEREEIEKISISLGKRLGSKIDLKFIKSEYSGIKVEVKDLGVELAFSKSRVQTQIIEHILKAI